MKIVLKLCIVLLSSKKLYKMFGIFIDQEFYVLNNFKKLFCKSFEVISKHKGKLSKIRVKSAKYSIPE